MLRLNNGKLQCQYKYVFIGLRGHIINIINCLIVLFYINASANKHYLKCNVLNNSFELLILSIFQKNYKLINECLHILNIRRSSIPLLLRIMCSAIVH